MSELPGDPVATMTVCNHCRGTRSTVTIHSGNPRRLVAQSSLAFSVDVAFHDHPSRDNGRGYFSARLEKRAGNDWELVQAEERTLGNDQDDGDWLDSLIFSVSATEQVEEYRIALHGQTKATRLASAVDGIALLQVIRGKSDDFELRVTAQQRSASRTANGPKAARTAKRRRMRLRSWRGAPPDRRQSDWHSPLPKLESAISHRYEPQFVVTTEGVNRWPRLPKHIRSIR